MISSTGEDVIMLFLQRIVWLTKMNDRLQRDKNTTFLSVIIINLQLLNQFYSTVC